MRQVFETVLVVIGLDGQGFLNRGLWVCVGCGWWCAAGSAGADCKPSM